MPNGFPPKGVAGLDRERIQRPEVCFGEPKQRAPAEPGDHERRNTTSAAPTPVASARRPEASLIQAVRISGEAPSSTAGTNIWTNQLNSELRDADLGQKAARDGEQRALLRRGMVILKIAEARVENGSAGGPRFYRAIRVGGRFVHRLDDTRAGMDIPAERAMASKGGFAVRNHMSLASIPPCARLAFAGEVPSIARRLVVRIRFSKALEQ